MKIAVIMGTPRKEQTYKMIGLLEESMRKQGAQDVDFGYLFIDEQDLGFCESCFNCYKDGEETCPKADRTLPILELINNSDGFILASPVYSDSYTALMKTFIDHFAFMMHRPRFFDKKAVIISTTHETGTDYTMDFMEQTARRWGAQVAGSLGIRMMRYTYQEDYREKLNNEIDKLAAKFIQALEDKVKRKEPPLSDLVFFKVMQTWTYHLGRDVNPTDYNYWKEHDWFNRDYYLKVRINPFKLALANMIQRRVKKALLKGRKVDGYLN